MKIGRADLSFFAKVNGGAAVLCLLTGPVVAQDQAMVAHATLVIEECLAERALASSCIGGAVGACLFRYDASVSVSVGPCVGAENAVWEARLAASMAVLNTDAAEAFAARVGWPDPQSELARVVATFEAYREAVCDMESALWGGGSGAGPAWAACRMRVTAEQALRLDEWLEVLQ